MSHHIHMLPGIIPLERPFKPDKKRRIRKARTAEMGRVGTADEIDASDEEFYLAADEPEAFEAQAELSSGSTSGRFSSETMKALLEVQAGN